MNGLAGSGFRSLVVGTASIIALFLFLGFRRLSRMVFALLTVLLAWSGIATADGMAAKRPYVIVGCFVVGMLLTPPDVISQLLLAVPTWLLFEIGILFARITERRTNEPG